MTARLQVVREAPAVERRGGATDHIDDAALVARAIGGDRRAEDALVRRHAREVARLVARLLGTHDGLDDVVQEVFLAAFVQLPTLREPAAFRGWLLRIAINKSRREIRRKRFLRTLGLDRTTPDGTLEALADDAVSPSVRAELSAVDAVLSRLPADQRIAWVLRVVEGHTVRDVSRLTACSVATAKRRIAAAREKVLSAVDEEVLGRGQ